MITRREVTASKLHFGYHGLIERKKMQYQQKDLKLHNEIIIKGTFNFEFCIIDTLLEQSYTIK